MSDNWVVQNLQKALVTWNEKLQEEPYPKLSMETEEGVEAVVRYLLDIGALIKCNDARIELHPEIRLHRVCSRKNM